MGKTFTNQARRFDDDFSGGRSGKHKKHANGRKTGGMKTLNSYVEDEYDDEYDDLTFDMDDEIVDDTSTDTDNTKDTP